MDAKAVGQRIKAAREKKSMTQEDLAARINISPTHVSVIERGTKIPRILTFFLAKAQKTAPPVLERPHST